MLQQSIQTTPSYSSFDEEKALFNKTIHQQWKTFVKDNHPTASEMLTRNLLLGKNIKNGFTPITNANKLNNGHRPFAGWEQAYFVSAYKDHPWKWACSDLSEEAQKAFIVNAQKSLKEAFEKERNDV